MSDEDVQKLLATCDPSTATGLRDRAFLELLYASGARISEVSRLNVPSIDFGRAQATLFGKGSKERIVPLYGVALDWLRRYLDEARQELASLAKRTPPEGPAGALFLSTRGRRMSADALRTAFEAHVRLAGLDPTLTPHAMRHTYATELVAGGADLRSVQELLGHESLSTTQVYTHLSVDRLKDATRHAHPRAQ
jgi:integrase/recombinase XerD